MAKKVSAYVKLQIPARKAAPNPPIGPALGQHGVNIMAFCKEFNARTQQEEEGLIFPVLITIYADRTFSFIIKIPPASVLLKRAAGIESGSAQPNKNKVARITTKQLKEIAQLKATDLSAASLEAAMRTIGGTARSMGIEIIEEGV